MKAYLGDAVYADFDQRGLVLTTEDGIRATNTIVLEPQVLQALQKYLAAACTCSIEKTRRTNHLASCVLREF